VHQTGPADVLKIPSIPTPEPGKGEVRVRVKAIGLNRAEVNRATLELKFKQLNITKNIFVQKSKICCI
jgi:NADPH:quinone reductase-like Zn-dependent oxidoreductase